MQALTGLWQIFVRQGSIPEAASDATLAEVLAPFAKIQSDRDIFDGGRGGREAPAKGDALARGRFAHRIA